MSELPKPYYQDDHATIYHGDCLELLPLLGSDIAACILTDPPYYNVLDEEWDTQWDTEGDFLDWLAVHADQWRQALAPNGALYCFATPRMSAKVEVMIGERFKVLNQLRWVKPGGWHKHAEIAAQRAYQSPWEACIFAEQFGSDGSALRGSGSGYDAACTELRAGVFEPIRLYLIGERDAAGVTSKDVDKWLGTSGMAGHYFGASQWAMPTEPVYAQLRELFNFNDDADEHLRREYEDLRREYEDLRREYEDLRRCHNLPKHETTDTLHYDSAPQGPNRLHPAAKPEPLIRHLLEVSTLPGGTVLDPFTGSGTTLRAAKDLGRKSIGIELDERYCEIAATRLGQEVFDFGDV